MNYLKIPETKVYEEVLKEMNLSKKTKSFWDYLFENHLVDLYIVEENATKGSKDVVEVIVQQLKMAQNEGVELNIAPVKNMLRFHTKRENLEHLIEELITLLPSSFVKEFISNNWYNINCELARKLLDKFTINELYEMKVIYEELIIENIEQFDKTLVRKKYGERLSLDFMKKYILPYVEPLNIADISINKRDNIGVVESYFYENSACCIEQMYSNGASVYIPYGIWVELFNSIDVSLRCMGNQIHDLKETIAKLDEGEQSREVEILKGSLLSQLEDLKKCELMLDGFADLKHQI